MNKYIDVEKLKKLIDEKWKELADKNVKVGGGKWDAEISTYLSVLRLIDTLQQEQPSLPSNLNEAAEEYAYNNWEDNDYHTGASEGLPFDAIGHTEKCFKAGACFAVQRIISLIESRIAVIILGGGCTASTNIAGRTARVD